MDVDSARTQIHETLSRVTPFDDPNDEEERDDELPDAGVLTGWLMIAEWQGSDGCRWLSKLSASATGENGLPRWSERGFAFEVAHHWDAD